MWNNERKCRKFEEPGKSLACVMEDTTQNEDNNVEKRIGEVMID